MTFLASLFGDQDRQEIPILELVQLWVQLEEEKDPLKWDENLFSETAKNDFTYHLLASLAQLSMRVFQVDFETMRLGLSDSDEIGLPFSYTAYLKHFEQDASAFQKISVDYPVLFQWMKERVANWKNNIREFILRFREDRLQLSDRFNHGIDFGKVIGIAHMNSKPYIGGQHVLELQFERGRAIFYKPRSVGMDELFCDFLEMVNAHRVMNQLKAPKTWSRGEYGWVEKIDHLPCERTSQVEDYYRRSGILLCFLYFFRGIDFHCENIIAHNEHPVLIDFETLFCPELHLNLNSENEVNKRYSVQTTSMLPFLFSYGNTNKRVHDISGLGGEKSRTRRMLKPNFNQVILKQSYMHAADYVDYVIAGFRQGYQFMQSFGKNILVKEGWLHRFSENRVSVSIRPGWVYRHLIHQIQGFDGLRKKSSQLKVLSVLDAFLEKGGNNHLHPVLEEEKRALMKCEFPLFHTYPNSEDLYVYENVIVKNAFKKTGVELVLQALNTMSHEECEQQVSIIKESFSSVYPK